MYFVAWLQSLKFASLMRIGRYFINSGNGITIIAAGWYRERTSPSTHLRLKTHVGNVRINIYSMHRSQLEFLIETQSALQGIQNRYMRKIITDTEIATYT